MVSPANAAGGGVCGGCWPGEGVNDASAVCFAGDAVFERCRWERVLMVSPAVAIGGRCPWRALARDGVSPCEAVLALSLNTAAGLGDGCKVWKRSGARGTLGIAQLPRVEVHLAPLPVFQVQAIKDVDDYYEKTKRAVDGRIPAGGYYEKEKRNLDGNDDYDEDEDEDDDDEDSDIDYEEPKMKLKQHAHRTRKALDEEREKREYEYYSRGKFARDIDDYVR
ncbi:hypothetical protein chiPu_0008250 [Chiloscyllium punctatum]|uniref:Uncharacterized protein n=1 Tax=Chiloscyllium punctatum TaxID=137246 RepID=A0A401SHD1_CHIPU|nr:hypothetical protein [Chiloscyllium punctatum]